MSGSASEALSAPVALIDAPVSTARSEGIDLLRACFALWVMFAHLVPWAGMISGGNDLIRFLLAGLGRLFQPAAETHPAVLGFIVLSGYCIHRNGFRRHEGSLQTYAVRRVFRILPVYILASIAGVLGFLASSSLAPETTVLLSGTQSLSARCIAAKFAGISVFLPSFHECSFQGNAPLTTVMVEIWLYALYALVVFFFLKRGIERKFWSWLLVASAIGVFYVYKHPHLLSWWHNGSLLGFALYWWVGAKFLDPGFRAAIRKRRWLVGLGWLALTACLLSKYPGWPILVELRKIAFAALIGSLIAEIDLKNYRIFGFGAALGKAGYSIYAFHAPLLIYLLVSGVPWVLVAVLTIGASLAIYAAYEAPFIRLGRKTANSLVAAR